MSRLKGARVVVVVQGELAQSPRMLNHVRLLLAEGATVDLVGYAGVALPDELLAADRFALHAVSGAGTRRWGPLPRPLFLVVAGLRLAWVTLRLGLALARVPRPLHLLLVQSPPTLPALPVAWLVARLRGARLIVDWHNYGWSMLGLRLGPGHGLVRRLERLEAWLGRRADGHVCVSAGLARDLATRFGVQAAVLHDRPRHRPGQAGAASRHDVLQRVAAALARDCGAEEAEPPALLVSPTSWSGDEDTGMLLDAMARLAGRSATPPLTLLVTGLGPGRAGFEARAATLEGDRLRIVTGWLEEPLYRELLAVADLGISVHRSASGLDLPMKLVDMLEAGLPPVVLDYGPCLAELLGPGQAAVGFSDAAGLADRLATLLEGFPAAPRLAASRAALGRCDGPVWAEEWGRQALPLLLAAGWRERPAGRRRAT